MPDDINALRQQLFETMRGLRAKTIDPDVARGMVDVAKVIVDTARVEVEMCRQTGHQPASGFIPLPSAEGSTTPPAPGSVSVQNVAGGTIRTHRLKG